MKASQYLKGQVELATGLPGQAPGVGLDAVAGADTLN
jgi:hypothetical protein